MVRRLPSRHNDYQGKAPERVKGSERKITQKIMKGKLYDTEKAKKIFTWVNDPPSSDHQHVKETLYLSWKGNFFVWSGSDEATGNVSVKALNRGAVQEWLESKEAPLSAYREAEIEIEEV